MLFMTREEILHLASLARIRLSDEEVAAFEKELPSILEYVSVVSEIAGDDADLSPELGARYNILRADEITIEPGAHMAELVAEMPESDGNFLKVKKILNTDD